MSLKDLRVGYVPYSNNLQQASDRRRFCYYAKKRNIEFEIANPLEKYDLIIVTQKSDLSLWSQYSNSEAKIIYDLIDSMLAIPKSNIKGMLRGCAKFITRESRYLQLNYWNSVQNMCKRADAVICSTIEQKQNISQFCKNVHIILDIHSTVTKNFKYNFDCADVFNLVWEGLPVNLEFFELISDVLRNINCKHEIALHLITSLEYGQYMDKYWRRQTSKVVKRILPLNNIYLYQWNEQMCSAIASACDLALIPIPLDNPFAAGKPENKLLFFWRLGVPTLVSATPAYTRAMRLSDLSMVCETKNEWEEKLEYYILNESARKEAGEKGKLCADKYYSEDIILAKWDKLLCSVLGDDHIIS